MSFSYEEKTLFYGPGGHPDFCPTCVQHHALLRAGLPWMSPDKRLAPKERGGKKEGDIQSWEASTQVRDLRSGPHSVGSGTDTSHTGCG